MKPEEKKYLRRVHKSIGYNPRRLNYTTHLLTMSQIKFKRLNKELKKKNTLIRNLKNKVESLKQRIEKIRKPVLNIRTKKRNRINNALSEQIEKEEYEKNKFLINRLERNLPPNKYYTKTELSEDFMIYNKKLEFCLRYLIKKKVIEEKLLGRFMRYKKIDEN